MNKLKIKHLREKRLIRAITTRWMLMVMMGFTLSSLTAQANTITSEPLLKINPEQCVALLQGQECYVTIELNWQVSTTGDYCIFSSQQTGALKCWTQQNKGDLKREFMAKTNIHIFLKQKRSQVILADAEVKMAWVHKKKGKPRMAWRMF